MLKDNPTRIKGEYPSKCETPVLLLFFNRPDTFALVFEQVKKARPAVLFLYQDGIRPGRGDEAGHAECRRIAENIDWDCALYRWYQDENQGCDPSGFLSHRWAFSHVERCIVLEDDCVPSQSFFPYCTELLERYKDDERINIICGMNNLNTWQDCKDSYFFGRRGSIWGWASWSRVVLDWREDYEWVKDPSYLKQLKDTRSPCRNWKEVENRFRHCAATGKPYFEVLMLERQLRRDSLNIIPNTNMIKNVGLLGGTHSDVTLEMYPRFYRKWMELEAQEISFPLKHPETVVQNVAFDRAIDPGPIQKILIWPERIFLQLIHGNGKVLWKKFCARVLHIYK